MIDTDRQQLQRKAREAVVHPAHYNKGKIEVIDFIEDQKLGFNAGNVIKYVCRYDLKGGLEDLRKARFYLDRLIADQEKEPTRIDDDFPF